MLIANTDYSDTGDSVETVNCRASTDFNNVNFIIVNNPVDDDVSCIIVWLRTLCIYSEEFETVESLKELGDILFSTFQNY